jgi:glycosyltransferase involved in cell wall biosynthesis
LPTGFASNVCGIPDVVEDGVTGFMTATDNYAFMANRMTRILSDPELQRQMGEKRLEQASKQFNQESKIKQYVECYESANAVLSTKARHQN